MSEPSHGWETLPATSQRGKSPKTGKGVGRKAKDPTTPVSVRLDQRKILSLKEQGFSEIGVMLADDTGKRVTVDKYGRVQWWCVDGSGVIEVCS